jgi:hypothetical protein
MGSPVLSEVFDEGTLDTMHDPSRKEQVCVTL